MGQLVARWPDRLVVSQRCNARWRRTLRRCWVKAERRGLRHAPVERLIGVGLAGQRWKRRGCHSLGIPNWQWTGQCLRVVGNLRRPASPERCCRKPQQLRTWGQPPMERGTPGRFRRLRFPPVNHGVTHDRGYGNRFTIDCGGHGWTQYLLLKSSQRDYESWLAAKNSRYD